MFSWLKNGRALRSSERMVITQTDPDISPGTTNLDIIDLKFTDFGTYTCVAALKGGGIPEISIDVNISSTTGESHTPHVTGTFAPTTPTTPETPTGCFHSVFEGKKSLQNLLWRCFLNCLTWDSFNKSLFLLLFMTNGENDALLSGENDKNLFKMTFSS